MKTAVSQICIFLFFSICAISSLSAQDNYGDEYNSVDVAVLKQITSQGGKYSAEWNCKNPRRLTTLGVKNMTGSLDVSRCSALTELWCPNNQLTSLNTSKNTALTDLDSSVNNLTSLNLKNGNNCKIEKMMDSAKPNRIEVDDPNIAALSGSYWKFRKYRGAEIHDGRIYNMNPGVEFEEWNNRFDFLYNIISINGSNLVFESNSKQLDGSKHYYMYYTYSGTINSTQNYISGTYLEYGGWVNTGEDKGYQPIWTGNFEAWKIEYSKPFSYENNWTVSKTSGMPEHPIGVVADGCSAIKINLTQNDKSITVENVGVRVFDINNEYIPTGNIGTSISQATSPYLLKNLSYLPDAIFYVAPDIVSYNILYKNEWNRKVVVQISINNSDYVLNDTIDIIRPPVLLVHGLNSDYKCFSQLQTELLDSDCYKTGQAYCVDYSPTNQAAFEENSHVLPNSIKGIKRDWTEKGYAVSKLDIVGHSMGGILSRLYLQSRNYDNNIHKLITVNTPHSGSQGANLLVAFPSIREISRFNGKAVDDLQVTSDAIRTLLNGSSVKKGKTVPSYSIVTETTVFSEVSKKLKDPLYCAISCAFLLKNPKSTLKGIIALAQFNNWLHNDVYNDDNDLVVAVNSQRGGLSSSTLVDNEWHCGSPDNPIVKSKISELLMLPSTDAAFSMQGFDPPTLNPPDFNFLGNINNNIPTKLKISVNKKDSVYFISPTNNNITAKSGDLITIEVARTANVKNLIFMAMESKDSVYLKDTTATSMSFTYHIPSTCIGTIPMYVFGADTLGNVYIDSISTTISSNATAKSLVITYPDASKLELSQGLQSAVRVSCLFSDNITRDITTLSDVQYSTLTGNAVILSQGVLKGAHKGIDTLIVSYAGLSCSLPINVNQDYTCTVNTSVSPDNTGATTGTGTFFYGDTVTLEATPETGYTFDYWSENGVKVSTNGKYSFKIYASRNLVTNFKSITSIENISIDNNYRISIYPNPNDGNFTIDINADYAGKVVINIISITGVQCDHIEFIKSAKNTANEINSKCFAEGIYFVEIILGEVRVTKKIIID